MKRRKPYSMLFVITCEYVARRTDSVFYIKNNFI